MGEATRRLRAEIESGRPLIMPGVHDPLSARLGERLGARALYLGGFATASTLGIPEPLITMMEQVDWARRIAQAVEPTPLIVDGHTGFGDPTHIARCVQEFEAAGVAAIHIEDQVFPREVGYIHKGLKHIVDVDDMRIRIQTACDARRDPNFMIIARTDARGAEGGSFEEALMRLELYREAGADALLPLPASIEEGREIAARFSGYPLMWAAARLRRSTPGAEPTLDEVLGAGYQMVMYPLVGICNATAHLESLYRTVLETGNAPVDQLDENFNAILASLETESHFAREVGSALPDAS